MILLVLFVLLVVLPGLLILAFIDPGTDRCSTCGERKKMYSSDPRKDYCPRGCTA